MRQSVVAYSLLLVCGLAADRVTKWVALNYLEDAYHINHVFSFDLVMNRGISWSLFHSNSPIIFGALSLCIAAIIGLLTAHTVKLLYLGYPIWAELIVLAGALSNFIDRILYGGVIDFIAICVVGWSWPVFNVADCFIVVGVLWMFIRLYRNP